MDKQTQKNYARLIDMSDEKTHYRKAFNSPYLSSADLVEPTDLTVKCVRLELDQTKKTKDLFNTAYFVETEIRDGEKLKPMILNATNSRMMKDLTGSHFIDDWNDVYITVYVDNGIRFGRDTVEGLRISPVQPTKQKPELTPSNEERWLSAVNAYQRDGNLNAVESRVFISDGNKEKLIEQANVSQH